jgi:hypothetical protein
MRSPNPDIAYAELTESLGNATCAVHDAARLRTSIRSRVGEVRGAGAAPPVGARPDGITR